MNTVWNEVELKIPPLVTIQVSNVGYVKHIRAALEKKSLQSELHNELANSAALLSRLIARRRNSFRNMYGFKSAYKLNSSLSRLLKADLNKILGNFYQTLPDNLIESLSHTEVPSKNSFDYVLIRLISVHKLHQRISVCCIEAADYFLKLLRNNFFIDTITIFLSVISKILDLSKKLSSVYSKLYAKLVAFRKCFPEIDTSSNFNNFTFPKGLDNTSGLNIEKIHCSSTHKENTLSIQKDMMPLAPVKIIGDPRKTQKIEDIGMEIERKSFKAVLDISNIHDVESVRKFFIEEDGKRKNSLDTCATKYILKHEWMGIQKLIERKIAANDNKRALLLFRKFIAHKL